MNIGSWMLTITNDDLWWLIVVSECLCWESIVILVRKWGWLALGTWVNNCSLSQHADSLVYIMRIGSNAAQVYFPNFCNVKTQEINICEHHYVDKHWYTYDHIYNKLSINIHILFISFKINTSAYVNQFEPPNCHVGASCTGLTALGDGSPISIEIPTVWLGCLRFFRLSWDSVLS